MRASTFVLFIACGLLVYVGVLWWRGRSTWLNAELRKCSVVLVEKQIQSQIRGFGHGGGDVTLVGRPDQVYRDAAGVLIPVEKKTRNRFVVYQGDVAELSLQAWLLRKSKEFTAPYGYVLIRRPDGDQKLVKVDLMDDAACIALLRKALNLRAGISSPLKSVGPKCRSCGHKTLCDSI